VAIANASAPAWPTTRRLPLRPGDDPLLPGRGADPRQRADLPAGRPGAARVRARPLHELVVKPTGESGGKGVFIGPRRPRSRSRRRRAVSRRARALDRPGARALSTVPTALPDGSLAPGTWTCARSPSSARTIKIVPGALTRVALREGR
jgi:uncharacterized circularly permuted ATP-grasp superfamily protein